MTMASKLFADAAAAAAASLFVPGGRGHLISSQHRSRFMDEIPLVTEPEGLAQGGAAVGRGGRVSLAIAG